MNQMYENPKIDTEIIDENKVKDCIFCGAKISSEFNYCTACGRIQKQDEKKQKRFIVKKKVDKIKKAKNLFKIRITLSIIFLSLSGISFIMGLVKLFLSGNISSVSLFGPSMEFVIVNSTFIISYFLMSIFFALLGMFSLKRY